MTNFLLTKELKTLIIRNHILQLEINQVLSFTNWTLKKISKTKFEFYEDYVDSNEPEIFDDIEKLLNKILNYGI